MANVIKQAEMDNNTHTIAGRLVSSKTSVRQGEPTRAPTKSICDATITTSGPFIETFHVGKKYKIKQASERLFFYRNPTPVRIQIINNKDDFKFKIHVCNAGAPIYKNLEAAALAASMLPGPPPNFSAISPATTAAIPATGDHPQIHCQTYQDNENFQAPQQPSKIVVESRDHEEKFDLAQLQTSILQLMYACETSIGKRALSRMST